MKEGEVEEKEESPEEGDEENQEELIKEVDEGEMLVLRRALNSQRNKKEEQRQNIVHSGCIVQGKVCSLIIGGSCTNMVSLSILKNLISIPQLTPISPLYVQHPMVKPK